MGHRGAGCFDSKALWLNTVSWVVSGASGARAPGSGVWSQSLYPPERGNLPPWKPGKLSQGLAVSALVAVPCTWCFGPVWSPPSLGRRQPRCLLSDAWPTCFSAITRLDWDDVSI